MVQLGLPAAWRSRLRDVDTTIYVQNRATLVTDAQAAQMASACATQITRDVAPAYGFVPVPVLFTAQTTLPTQARVITLVDTLQEQDALGWHAEDGSHHIYGQVGAKVVLDQGAKVLTGPYAVSTILSHEVVELFVDPFASLWADTGRGFEITYEACDPVQSDRYDIGGVSVSSFVTAEWFNPYAGPGVKFDYLGKLSRPFSMDRGGYWVQRSEGRISQRFGEGVPEWVKIQKAKKFARAQRRVDGVQAKD